MRAVVVDDEPLIRGLLRDLLAAEPGVEVVGEGRNGREALEVVRATRPDVVYLDVQMPGMSGLEVAARLAAETGPRVVFVTAYDAHAVRAFELDALDYLLKPVDPLRIRASLERVRRQIAGVAPRRDAPSAPQASPPRPDEGDDARPSGGAEGAVGARPDEALSTTLHHLMDLIAERTAAPVERFLVTIGGRMRVILASEIEWVEADGNYVRLHTAGSSSALLRDTMKALEARLGGRDFVRVHRSALVRVSSIRELRPQANGDYAVQLASGAVVVMSRTFRDAVIARLAR